jgi:hypothetical protein
MNRTPSEAAKALGGNVAQVKHWAWLFSDYLTEGANPPSGKARTFCDGDMLVLCYVWHEWEAEPDVESIKVGLNRGYHLEERFVEHLYIHTPLLQDPPDDLDESWRHGILLNGMVRFHDALEFARNYRHVAESMLQTALARKDVECWAYPVLFAYRHTLELYLKLIGEIEETTHSLRRCVHLVEKRRDEKLSEPIRGWILELEVIDPAGTTFRYSDEEPKSAPFDEIWFDFQHFQFAMNRVFDLLDTAILRAGANGRLANEK